MTLDEFEALLASLASEKIADTVVASIASAIEADVASKYSSGQSPDGTPWSKQFKNPTGKLENSRSVTVQGSNIHVSYDAPHASIIDRDHPLTPQKTPTSWEKIMSDAFERIMKEKLER